MCFTAIDADHLVSTLDGILARLSAAVNGHRAVEQDGAALRSTLWPPAVFREVLVYRRTVPAVLALAAAGWLVQAAGAAAQGQAKPAAPLTDLDAFMSRVLERRNENWKTLHDYILSERETFQILARGIPLAGQRREFQWFIRDGYLVRSPSEPTAPRSARRIAKYEADWLKKEQDGSSGPGRRRREGQGRETRRGLGGSGGGRGAPVDRSGSDKEVVALVGTEPASFRGVLHEVPFEPGNYYLAGRETIDGRPVVKVEYYPTRLFTRTRIARRRRSPSPPRVTSRSRRLERSRPARRSRGSRRNATGMTISRARSKRRSTR